MRNYEKYNYHNYEAPNIFGEFHKTHISTSEISIVSILHAPITILAKKHPEWTFISDSHWALNSLGHYVARGFRVYRGDYMLGTIKQDYLGQQQTIGIDNDRLRAHRKRERGTRTKDAKKAVLIVEKNFFVPTVTELVIGACSVVSEVIERNAYEKCEQYTNLMGGVQPRSILGKLGVAVICDPDAHRDMLISAGVTKDEFDLLSSTCTAAADAESLKLVKDNNKGSVVLIIGQDYIVTNAVITAGTVENTKVCSTDTLPPAFKRKLGMLKLLEVGCYIADVGVRAAEHTFFVDGVL